MILPRLRANLDMMPSPAPDRPGLLMRDSYQYSDTVLIIPPLLVRGLEFFDGVRTDLDMRAEFTRLTGELETAKLSQSLIDALSRAAFLEDETYWQRKEKKHRTFVESAVREPAHVGSAYPEEPTQLRGTMARYLSGNSSEIVPGLIGIAAPHVSPEGGWQSYRAAYRTISPDFSDRTFVVLGTSHYGQPDKFGLTRKPFATPFGASSVDLALVDELSSQPAVLMEDYCHSIEHSIEFQVLFLQSIYGPDIRILPILCGSYGRSFLTGTPPEHDEGVKRFLGALGEMGAREGKRLFWVLGIDMAHMGSRYGDDFTAVADEEEMLEIGDRDKARIERINAGDARGFWDMVQPNHDELKWCGSAPLYTFLRAMPTARGTLHRYEQWNIDERSVVSFAGMSFSPGA